MTQFWRCEGGVLTIYLAMGQANEKIARIQDSYVSKASETWLESMERTLTQMKEYQVWKACCID